MAVSFRRVTSAGLVSALGVGLLWFPLLDILDDWTNPPHKPLWSTLFENSPGLALALTLVVGGLWLYTRDWSDEYVVNAAKWSLGVLVAFAVLLAWVLGIQQFVQNDLKPYFIALDAVVFGGVVALGIGIYDSRRRRNESELALERDRLSALYENAEDAIATVRFDDGPVVESANSAFRERYDDIAAILSEAPGVNGTYDSLAGPLADGDAVEFEWDGPDGDRSLLVNATPITTANAVRAHVRIADITEQKHLARESAARERLEHLHRVASDLSAADTENEAYDRTLNALRTAVGFDAACVVAEGDVVAARGTRDALDWESIDRIQPGAVPTDGGATTRQVDGATVLTVPVGDDAVLQASITDDEFEDSQVTAAELLGTHLRETRKRLDREARLRDQHERLELLARTFRHDLLNDVNVINARATVLEDHVDDDATDYLDTLEERADDMEDRIETMRSLMKAVEGEHRDLDSLALAPVVKDAVDDARDTYPSAAFELDTPLPADVVGDDLLPDVFQNLLANAVEHNDTDAPRVRVSGERADDAVVVTVADNGPGVPPERRDAVFDLGEKGVESGGTGVGLNLCHRIVETYGGSLTVADDADLGGAAFRVRLPLSD
ncbi:ATP-binding protein [Salarchaeum japonicum]|uniref:histidine kinase n=1 Tax=Salarchaeum japonicum TaxID=555573 RepID=A0AAV3SZS0_9EURY|nr:ATP-binding protein [Salarchaeum japonicum]